MNWLVIYRSDDGEYHWKFEDKKGTVLAFSGTSYKRKASCLKAARAVLQTAWEETDPC